MMVGSGAIVFSALRLRPLEVLWRARFGGITLGSRLSSVFEGPWPAFDDPALSLTIASGRTNTRRPRTSVLSGGAEDLKAGLAG